MDYSLGTYKFKCNFDPKVINNADKKKKKINDIGFIYNCVFNQEKAFLFSLDSIRKIFPESKIYVVSDGGLDFSFIENDKTKFIMDIDTVSPLKLINRKNYLEKKNQMLLKQRISTTIQRVCEGIKYCNYPEWFCVTEPDVYIRGQISYPENAKLLGTRINYAWHKKEWIDSFIDINRMLELIPGSVPLVRWGSVPVIGKTETFLKGVEIYKKYFDVLDGITEKYDRISDTDLFLPFIFSLVGEQEVFSSEYTECLRNPDWEKSSATVIHQFRKYYGDNDFFWGNSKKNSKSFLLKSFLKKLISKI